jgi:hypothetical protein
MGNTNYFSTIVKVLENPKKSVSQKNIPISRFRAELPQIRKNRAIHLVFWGNLANHVSMYYQANDYLIIEGYLSIKHSNSNDLLKKNFKTIEVAVLKVYPFFLNPKRQKSKM